MSGSRRGYAEYVRAHQRVPAVPRRKGPDPATDHGAVSRFRWKRGHDAMILACAGSQAVGSSTSMLRVRFGSTGMPGPMVVEKVTFFRYRPFADDGLARRTSSSAAA